MPKKRIYLDRITRSFIKEKSNEIQKKREKNKEHELNLVKLTKKRQHEIIT